MTERPIRVPGITLEELMAKEQHAKEVVLMWKKFLDQLERGDI